MVILVRRPARHTPLITAIRPKTEGRDVTAFSGAPLRQFTQPLRRLWFPKITLWKQPSKGLVAPWPLALRCHATQKQKEKRKNKKVHHINKGLTLFVGEKI